MTMMMKNIGFLDPFWQILKCSSIDDNVKFEYGATKGHDNDNIAN